jgi:iron complex outermembrane receptor protein
MSRICGYRSALLLGTALGVMSGLGLMSGAALADEPAATLESIVVTAQKREENLQVVPVAVSVLTSTALEEARYVNVDNLNGLAPGLTIRQSAGGAEEPNLTMRGVFGSASYGSDPGVAMYIDGVYLSNVNGSDVDLADIERIEVLRGPQGTLFGRNALGGAVNIITKEPAGKFAFHQQFSYGNLNQYRSKTRVDSPSWGDFSASVTYLHDQMDGDVRNLGAGTAWDYGPTGVYGWRTSPTTLGGHKTDALFLALKYDSELFKAVYRFNFSHDIYVPAATGILTFNTGPGANAFLGGLFGGLWQAQNPYTRTPISSTRPESVNNWYSTSSLDRDIDNNLTITAPITNHISIKNLLAWRDVHLDLTNNLSGIGGLYSPVYPNAANLPIENDEQDDQRSFQEELDVNIDAQWVHSTIGYMHYFSHDIQGGFPGVPNAPFGSGLFPGVPYYAGIPPYYTSFTAPILPGVLLSDVHLTSDAIYTQNEIHVLPKLDVVLGLRGTSDHRGGVDNSPTPAGPGVAAIYNANTPTYLVGLNYKITDDIFTYVKWSTAYITGGRLANIQFDKETANSYEAGIKSDLLDHKLRVNLALYTAKYEGVQVFTNPAQGCKNFPGLAIYASSCIVNGGNERATGAEVEVTWVPVEGLTLNGSTAYTHVTLSDVPSALIGPDGNYVPIFIPAWTGMLAAQYRGPDMNALGDSHLTARIDANYVSDSFGSTPNSTAPVANAAKIPTRTIVNARLGLGGFQFGGGNCEIAGYIKNLTDNKAIVYDFNAAAVIPVNYQQARTYGVDLLFDF